MNNWELALDEVGSLLRPPPGTLGSSRPPRKAGRVAAATGRSEVSGPEHRRLELELGHESQPPSGPLVPPCPLVADAQARDSREAQKAREWAEAMWARPVSNMWEVILNGLFTASKKLLFILITDHPDLLISCSNKTLPGGSFQNTCLPLS